MTSLNKPQTEISPCAAQLSPQDDVSELSAPISDVEPETTATAARVKSKNDICSSTKRSYKTVEPCKRKQLIHMVNVEQKTIKEAANRLKINYSTAKHIIKSKKSEQPVPAPQIEACRPTNNFLPPLKQGPFMDISKLERKIQALAHTSPSTTLFQSSLVGEPS